MTKTIEFVEQNIFECTNHIQYLNSKINEDKKYPSLVKYHKERIEHLKPILQCLKQIKTELKAWEEIKKYIVVEEGYVNLYDSYYSIISFDKGCIDEAESEEEGVSVSIIKKALEVEDD